MSKIAPIILFLILASFATSIISYQFAPNQIPSHWNAAGEVDSYLSKFWGLFLMPIVIALLSAIFLALPEIDPKKNIQKFRKHYDLFLILFTCFMLAVQIFIIAWTFGIKISPAIVFPIGIGVLFFYIGVLLSHAKQNWFVGIRTPWTLSSKEVWDKTHKLGSVLFKVSGALCLIGIFFQKYAFLIVLIPIIFSAIFLVIYSAVLYYKK